MDVGIGLPAAIPGVSGASAIKWAQKAETGPFADEQLETMKRIWAGGAAGENAGAIGAPPVRDRGRVLLIGANSPRAMARVGKWGDGFIAGAGEPDMAKQSYDGARQSQEDARREGEPPLAAGAYIALDDDAKSTGAENIMHYYGEPFGSMISEGLPDSVDAFKELISGFSDAGCDELILWPTVTDLDQVERLTELI
jgi:alkanesulfonate monooxygenase SsuD/methylene tetrahydromethanopterin reductase-like flavin-dependent oxidoreductase (luciferase family)